MVKYRATGPNLRQTVGIGITAADVEKMRKGERVVVALDKLGLHAEIDVTLFYGETYQDVTEEVMIAAEEERRRAS